MRKLFVENLNQLIENVGSTCMNFYHADEILKRQEVLAVMRAEL